jgi:simple sugar transport system permease protein
MAKSAKVSVLRRIGYSLVRCKEIGALISCGLVFLSFSLLIPDRFLTLRALESLLVVATRTGLLAIGMSLLLISKEIDLSVGSVYAFIMCLAASLIIYVGLPVIVAFALSLGAAILIGLVTGVITTKVPLPAFITTLGFMMVWRGIALGIWLAWPMTYESPSLCISIVGGRFIGRVFNLSIVWLVLAAVLLWVLLEKTDYGNWVYATGDKEESARALGINTQKVKIINFVILALLTGFSGLVQFSRLGLAVATEGVGLELEAIAAAVIGGTSLFGGYGTIWGAILGILLISMLIVGVILAGISAYWYRALIGGIIILAVAINRGLLSLGG